MSKTGKISTIKREFPSSQTSTMQSELAKKGISRIPGTGVFKYPYKELDGQYRTGLNPDAAYIRRIKDDTEREIEIERVKKLKIKLEAALNIDLSPRSTFWNNSLSKSNDDAQHVQPVKLMDGDNLFDLSLPFHELAYSWLRVHPTIASSLQAWERGEYPADTQFYVVDDEVENNVVYKKKILINNAIVKFSNMTPEKRKKIARQLGLPIDDNSKEEIVYNLVDNALKQTEMKSGKYSGLNPIEVFNRFADMKESILHVKDLIKQAITHNVYKLKPTGKIYKGEYEVAKDEDELVKFLVDDDHQEDIVMLEQDIKSKKLAAV